MTSSAPFSYSNRLSRIETVIPAQAGIQKGVARLTGSGIGWGVGVDNPPLSLAGQHSTEVH